jgi:AcrR family transcriptional regulator
MATAAKPLRADAQRNRDRLVAAGREVFAERGFEASLDDVAHHAGVGVGTAYRRFPNKEALIDEIFEERVNEMLNLLEEGLANEDPWDGLQTFIGELLRFQVEDRGLKEAFHEREGAHERIAQAKTRMQPMITELIEGSQAAGKLRADVAPQDVLLVVTMLGTVIDATRSVRPDAWRRYLVLALDGLAATKGESGELPGSPLTFDEFDEAMRCLHG